MLIHFIKALQTVKHFSLSVRAAAIKYMIKIESNKKIGYRIFPETIHLGLLKVTFY